MATRPGAKPSSPIAARTSSSVTFATAFPSIISAAIMNILALLAGTLCVLSNEKLTNCTATEGALLHLQPAAESQRVVWTSDDGKRLAVAWIPPDADVLDLGKLDEVALRISGDPRRGWPAD